MKVISIFLIIAGIFIGLYMGLWWALVGGVLLIIEQIRAEQVQVLQVAYGVFRIFFAGLIGYLSAILVVFPGMALYDKSNRVKERNICRTGANKI